MLWRERERKRGEKSRSEKGRKGCEGGGDIRWRSGRKNVGKVENRRGRRKGCTYVQTMKPHLSQSESC